MSLESIVQDKSVIFSYVRKSGNPIGVILSKKVVKKVKGKKRGKVFFKIGWSKCNRKHGDKFDKEIGVNMALSRCITGQHDKDTAIVPFHSRDFKKFVERMKIYYKMKNVVLNFDYKLS